MRAVTIAIAGCLAACAGPVDPVPDAGSPELVPACACSDLRCIEAWVAEHLGCDLCAHVACDAEMIGVCVPCP